MTESQVFGRILDRAGRADPYPLYAELRKTPVAALEDGSYVVSTYREIVALLHDPRVSSDRRNLAEHFADREPVPPGREPPSSSSTRPSTTGCAAWRCGTSARPAHRTWSRGCGRS